MDNAAIDAEVMESAVLDVDVLYSAALRDLLLRLAAGGLFMPFWSEEIQNEWTRNVLQNCSDVTPEKLERTCQAMNTCFPKAIVREYEAIIPGLQLPDPDDRHVLAAAIHIKAKYIVTFNLDDFPQTILQTHGIEALSPDEFALRVIKGVDQYIAFRVIKRYRSNLNRPPLTVDEHLAILELRHLTKTVAFLREHKAYL